MVKPIFLIGLPGSGKSTLGKQLAAHYNCKFFDLDEEIVKRVGKTIPEYIQFQGEGNFRIVEKEVLHELSNQNDAFVMATGGGTPCFYFNMDQMNKKGTTVYLDVGPGDIALRILEQGLEQRPLIKSYDQMDLIQEIRALKENRSSFYSEATHILKGNRTSLEQIVALLVQVKN